MIYIKNTNTNQIEQFSSIPSSYYGEERETFINENGIKCERSKLKDEYILLTENDLEVQKILLEEKKKEQIALIKEGRKQELDKDHFPTDAFVLEMPSDSEGNEIPVCKYKYVLDENGQKIRKKFKFKLTGGQTALNQPDVIIMNTLVKSIMFPNEDISVEYSCEFTDGTRGYVAIDKEVAISISEHLQVRATTLVGQTNIYEKRINSIFISEEKTFEQAKAEIEAIKPVF